MQATKKKSLIQKWAPVLESDIGSPIRSQTDASVLACLMENQVKLNKGFLPESTNVTADVEVYQQYALPLIRRQFPELLAMNTVAVIPTTTPQGIYFALRYLYDGTKKTTAFRHGQNGEIGFDLWKDFTGYANYYTGATNGGPWTTSEGEYLSNFMGQQPQYGNPYSALPNGIEPNTGSQTGGLGLVYDPENFRQNMRMASIKVIKGSVIVGTRAIKSHYTLELQQDLAAVHGQDIEALLLEALQFEIQEEIDREILSAMIYVATTPALGGEAAINVNLNALPTDFARWAAEKIAAAIVNTILAVSQKIAVVSRMGSGNFVICSPDIVAALSTLNNGIYIPTYLNTNVTQQPGGGVAEAGTLIGGGIKVYRDIFATVSYALVGYKGARQGESGIIFMPYIPYIFTKTAGQDDGSPRLIVKSRYAVVANLLGAGQFYRFIMFQNVNSAILGIDTQADYADGAYPWEVVGASFDPLSDSYGPCGYEPGFLGGVGPNGCGGIQGDTFV